MVGPSTATMFARLAPSSSIFSNRGIGDAGKRPLPARMGAANDARPLIGKKHRPAIGGERSQDQARNIGHHAINLRALVIGPRLFDNQGFRTMHLERGDDLRLASAQGLGDDAAVAHHGGAVIAGPQPAIERGEDAGGMAALPSEEAMGDAGLLEFAGLLSWRPEGIRHWKIWRCCYHDFEEIAHFRFAGQPCNGPGQDVPAGRIGF